MYVRGIGHCGAGCGCDACRCRSGMGQTVTTQTCPPLCGSPAMGSDWMSTITGLLTNSFQVGTFMIPVWAAVIAGVGLMYGLTSGGAVRSRR